MKTGQCSSTFDVFLPVFTRRCSIAAVLILTVVSFSAAGFQCQSKACTIVGSEKGDRLQGTAGDDVICGLGGHDVIEGLGGNDLICGGHGNDQLFGNEGQDHLVGNKGRDQLFGGENDDELDGSQGNDRLEGGGGNDFLVGGHGKDSLDGGVGSNLCETDRYDTVAACIGQSEATTQTTATFSSQGQQIFDPDGEVFEVRGVNIFPWHRSPATIDSINQCWQLNTVRLHAWVLPNVTSQWKDHLVYIDEPVLFNAETVGLTSYDVGPLIEYYTARKIVVIFDIHEKIGHFFNAEELDDYLTFITDFAAKFRDNPYVWLDIHNEPGAYEGLESDFSQWRNEVSTILSTVKAIAPNMMTLVSGTAWGQDTGPNWSSAPVATSESALLSNTDLLNRYTNTIATFHVYDQWAFGTDKLRTFVDQLLRTANVPVVVGEYGSLNNNSTLSASASLHELTLQPEYSGLGRIVWTWDAYDENNLTTDHSGGGQYVDSCEDPGNLTPLGKLVWEDAHRVR